MDPLSANENIRQCFCGVVVGKNEILLHFHGLISDFIDNCMELTNNKLPRNDSGGGGISSENKDSLSHTELHRTVAVIPGIEKNKKEIIIVTCSFRTAACGIF